MRISPDTQTRILLLSNLTITGLICLPPTLAFTSIAHLIRGHRTQEHGRADNVLEERGAQLPVAIVEPRDEVR